MKSKVVNSISFVAALAIGVLSVGCGGGGGSSTTTTPTAATSTATLTGTVVVASSSAGGAVGAAAVTQTAAATSSLIEGAVINIASYDKSGKLLGETAVNSSNTGSFSANLPLSSAGGYVVLTSHKEGFIDFSRRVDYETPGDINLMAEMDAANVVAVPVGATSTTIGSSSIIKKANGKEYVLFAYFKDASGKGKMMVGKAALSRMATGDKPSVALEIPKESIPSDVTSLVGSINSYDPTNPEDAKKFPGSYADSKGNKLVSLGFDFIDIKTDGGQTLGAAIKKAVAKGSLKKSAANAPYYVTRWMNSSNCASLAIGDADKNASNGYNIPIFTYSYNSGLWEQLGQGTIVKTYSSDITDFKSYSDSNASAACTANYGDYVKIEVTNKDYLNSPWNLDHILTSEPKQVCVQGKVMDQSGKAIKQSIYFSFYDNESSPNSFNWGSTSSKNDGTYKMTTVLVDNTDSDRVGTISYYNPYSYENVTVNATLGDYPNCTTQDINVTAPQMCTVTGQVKDDTGAVKANETVYVYSSSPYMYRTGSTGSDGNFSIETRCALDQSLYVRNKSVAKFNPDGIKAFDEVSDENNVVGLGTFTIVNQAPYSYGWLSSNSIKLNGSTSIGIYGYDYDGDVPLTWVLKDNGVQFDTNTTTGNYLYQYVDRTFTTTGDHNITLTVSDSKGKSTTSSVGTVEVVALSRAPKITNYYADKTVIGVNKSNTLHARGYDLDGDNVNWNYKKGSTTLCSGTATGGSFDTNCTYTTSATDANETITFTATDNSADQKSSSRDLTVRVQNTAPIIANAYASSYRTDVSATITLNAVVYDIDGDLKSVDVKADGVSILSSCTATGTGTQADPFKGTCTYTMPSTPATVTFRLDVSDNSSTRSSTMTVVGGTTAGLEIKIQ
ncbi:MAG: hypothetical protein PHW64_05155 [Sulfuricurvum sp.]|nr:hypothetical protein [Sulfuricurvum sp.]